jgi:hypothetical protein
VIFTSPDFVTWKEYSSVTNNILYSVTYGNNMFVAVGTKCTIVTSKADNVGVVLMSGPTKADFRGIKINIGNNCIPAKVPLMTSLCQMKVAIFNVSGKRMYSAGTTLRNGTLNISATGFPSGTYVMSITDANSKTSRVTFVLTK